VAQLRLLPHEQFGFRKRHSTVSQLARISDFITDGYNLHKHTGMVSLDIEKAYDTVWINGLLFKLISFNLPPYLIHILHAFLTNRSFTVRVSDTFSAPKTTPSGLPQGAVLSTTLFALYISDIPHPPHTHLALYADDTALFAQSWRTDTIVRRLTSALSVLHRYFIKWKLQVNTAKTAAVFFTKRRPPPPPALRFHLTDVPWSPHIKYLGLQLDSKLLYTKHLTDVTHRAMGVLLAIFPLLARDSTLSLHNKLILYKLLIRPILTYAAPVWSNTSTTNYRRLQILQSKCLRVIGNLPRRTPIPLLHSTLRIEPLYGFIYRLSEKFFRSCSFHPNPLIRHVGDYDMADLQRRYPKYVHKRTTHLLL
jgi:hypothetical protein